MRLHKGALVSAGLAATILVATVGIAGAQSGQTGSNVSGCDNPVLNRNLDGWGKISGSTPFRYQLADHKSATAAYVQANNPGSNPKAWLPQMPVKAGGEYTFSFDTRTDVAGQARVEVDWYSATNAFLGHDNGPAVALAGGQPTVWKKVSGDFTAPAGAVRANVLAGSALPAGADFSLTACEYLPASADVDPEPEPTDPPVTTDPTTPPTTTEPPPVTTEPPPAGDQTEAAVKFNWGTPIAAASDEFNYTGAPDPAKWGLYSGAGHDGNGRRVAERNTVDGSKLVQTGLANGDSAGMASKFDQRYGRWEARVRSISSNPGAGRQYHPLLIIWPESNRWPDHGEYDFLENGAPGQACAEAFLHYPGHTPKVQEFAKETNCGAPLSEWHNVALDWTPEALTGYIDGKQWFKFGEHDMTAMPSGHLTIQLDNFFGGSMTPARYEIDWVRTYAP